MIVATIAATLDREGRTVVVDADRPSLDARQFPWFIALVRLTLERLLQLPMDQVCGDDVLPAAAVLGHEAAHPRVEGAVALDDTAADVVRASLAHVWIPARVADTPTRQPCAQWIRGGNV